METQCSKCSAPVTIPFNFGIARCKNCGHWVVDINTIRGVLSSIGYRFRNAVIMKDAPPIRKYSVIMAIGFLILFALFRIPESDTNSTPGGDVRSQSTYVAQQSRPSRAYIRTNKGIRMNRFGGLGAAYAASSLMGARRGATEIVSDDELLPQNRKLASDMGPVKGRRLKNILTDEGSR